MASYTIEDNILPLMASLILFATLIYFFIGLCTCVMNPSIETNRLLPSIMSVSRFITLAMINAHVLVQINDSEMHDFILTGVICSTAFMAVSYIINLAYYLHQQRNFHVKKSRLSNVMVIFSGDAYAPMKYARNAVHGFMAGLYICEPLFQTICLAVMIPTENLYLRWALIFSIAVRAVGQLYHIMMNNKEKKNRPQFYVFVNFKTDDPKDLTRMNVAITDGKISEIHQRRAFELEFATLVGCKTDWIKFELFTVQNNSSFHVVATHDIAFYSPAQPDMSVDVEEKRLHYMYRHEPAQLDIMQLFKDTFSLEGNLSGFQYVVEPSAASGRKKEFLRVLAEKGAENNGRTGGDSTIVVYGNEEEKYDVVKGVETPDLDDNESSQLYGPGPSKMRESRIEGMETKTGGVKGRKGSPRLSVIKQVDEQ